MQVVSPGLGKIFPRMRRRVAANERRLPVGRRAIGVVFGEPPGVVSAFVAEQLTKGRELGRVAQQLVPVKMPAFMAKVTEQRAIAFVKPLAALRARHLVGLTDIERDDARS